MEKKSPQDTSDEPVAEEFEFDEAAADDIETALDDSEGHENERGLTNWHVS